MKLTKERPTDRKELLITISIPEGVTIPSEPFASKIENFNAAFIYHSISYCQRIRDRKTEKFFKSLIPLLEAINSARILEKWEEKLLHVPMKYDKAFLSIRCQFESEEELEYFEFLISSLME